MNFIETSVDSRITQWRDFRTQLEVSKDPLQETQDLWNNAPVINRYLDPWDSQQWPTPWELLKENRFCPVGIPLMMGWTLKLTTRFSQAPVLIKISIDHTEQRYYNLCYVGDKVLNYTNKVVDAKELTDNLIVQFQQELTQAS